MIKRQNELVTTFRDETGQIVGLLVQNGRTDFYRATRAPKSYVEDVLLEVSHPEVEKCKEKKS